MPDKPALYGGGSVQADAGGAAVPPGSFFADFPGFGMMGPLEKHRQEAHRPQRWWPSGAAGAVSPCARW